MTYFNKSNIGVQLENAKLHFKNTHRDEHGLIFVLFCNKRGSKVSATKARRWVDLVGKIQAVLLGSRLFYQLESRSSAERVDQ